MHPIDAWIENLRPIAWRDLAAWESPYWPPCWAGGCASESAVDCDPSLILEFRGLLRIRPDQVDGVRELASLSDWEDHEDLEEYWGDDLEAGQAWVDAWREPLGALIAGTTASLLPRADVFSFSADWYGSMDHAIHGYSVYTFTADRHLLTYFSHLHPWPLEVPLGLVDAAKPVLSTALLLMAHAEISRAPAFWLDEREDAGLEISTLSVGYTGMTPEDCYRLMLAEARLADPQLILNGSDDEIRLIAIEHVRPFRELFPEAAV